jgi:O-antigen/teichoic acid export membrane protein
MVVAKALLSGVYFSIVLIFSFVFQYGSRAIYLVCLLAVVQILNSFLLYLRSNVSAFHHFKTDSLLSVLDKILMIIICSFLLFSPVFKNAFKIEWFIYAQISAYLVAVLIALYLIITRYSKIAFKHFSMTEVLVVCKKSMPYAVLILLMGIYMRSDVLMLERMAGAVENGIYSLAYRILDASNMIAFLFAGILLPMFSRMLSQKLDVENLVATTANIMLSASLALVAFSVIYAPDILSLLYHDDADDHLITIFSFVIGSFPAFCIMYIYSTLLTANGNIRLLIKIALFGSVFSIVLNLFMIHSFKAAGAAVTCFAVEWTLAFIYIYYCIQQFKLAVNLKRVLKFVLVFLIVWMLNELMHYFNMPLMLAIPINMLVFIVVVYSIKLWDKNIIASYLKQYKTAD